jgi:hypothetical protein
MAAKIFISYRRDDSAGYAGRVHDQLVERLGSNVFMDVDGIPLGSNFVKALNDEVAKCSALLAVIGPDWLDARDKKTGQRRLENPHDFVRVEIGAALTRQIPVIPILLEGTTIPSEDQLPPRPPRAFPSQWDSCPPRFLSQRHGQIGPRA